MLRMTLPSAIALWMAMMAHLAGAAEPNGEQIYKAMCARCHGPQGEGSKKFPRRLEGDRSVGQLSDLIAKTMPENDPGLLSPKEADAVAAYVHDKFYSKFAQERNREARIELARLTVRQYRQSVADLVGGFRPPWKWSEERGLKGEYYKGRRFNPSNKVLDRIDPQVDFDFGTGAAVAEKVEPHEFNIRWSGSVTAPDSGEYEFVVRTEHAARLWVNELDRPLIDAWVKSGNDTEYRARIFLIGGRVYPLRLEFSKAKQGVDDSKKQKEKPKSAKASIVLMWKRPHRALEPISSRQLSPHAASESFVCATQFPPDDRSYGWERGTTISKEWDQAATDAALETAAYVAAHLDELIGMKPVDRRPRVESGNPSDINLDGSGDKPSPERAAKVKQFCRQFAERAFRRPLSAEQSALIDKQLAAAKDLDSGVKRVVLLVLKSPRFLYHDIGGSDQYETASRLAFGLWDSIPDPELLASAAEGKLANKEEIARQAERMLTDWRGRAKLRDFLLTWLKADHGNDVAKDPKAYPDFDAAVISDLRTSLELFLDSVVWSEKSDFRELLLSDEVPMNSRLARFYSVEVAEKSDFTMVKLDRGRRAGALTHPYLMTSFAHSSESSPIHRGVFLARGVLGISLKPPPEAVAPLSPDLHPSMTTRERVELQTKAAACMTCHAVINPLGFTLENFDAVGRYREFDHNKPIDAAGRYRTRDGKAVTVKNARELATFLAGSAEAHEAFIEQMFHYLVQQPVRAYGPARLEELRKAFVANRFHVRKLAAEIMATSAQQGRSTSPPAKAPSSRSETGVCFDYSVD